MNLLEGMKKNSTTLNTKGGEYYTTSYDINLDLFSKLTRFTEEYKIIGMFEDALEEDENLALANLLYFLDIRGGKGERRIFKTIYKYLCMNYPEKALRILPFIGELGRYDYILEGLDTKVEEETINIIKMQLELDLKSDKPSLLAKWLPSLRTHGESNKVAKKLTKLLNMSEKDYRKTLSHLRDKINIVEKNLTNKDYEGINFAKVPSKAMLKYEKAFNKNTKDKFDAYKTSLKNGETKINTKGLFPYEIIKKIISKENCDEELYNLMWENQKELFDTNENLLVVADTSGSMMNYNAIPYCTSVGLAMYIAERNKGFFKNHFITFSEKPTLQIIKGKNLSDKVHNMQKINAWNTDIDLVFELILKTAKENKLKQKDMPSHILIISDMEFDRGVYSKTGTNFNGWKENFKKEGFDLPVIIFWNVAGNSKGLPVTKFDNDVAIVSGFSTNILDNLLTLEKYTPENAMLEKLSIYLEMLK